ncbi:hypothetical protein HN371_19640 [Candidatus Poribacteria bacterium]|jgi:purine-binding chemotaxis protein CheW|nr:hypothetical protein [Candidatus Poribacteria bacterium]MBT5534865.1 hypothetical protein [Candidatus Poribacteria bacterium]MBT5714695.1 hypothetical protein [Candidatus Poribacteria bacterium]MBT7097998.1 hypothetical protein [Candidatus Poribacteria bacterium]MBT7804504.1 hypothetical protein [Candidatus Poribacteria bacterium]
MQVREQVTQPTEAFQVLLFEHDAATYAVKAAAVVEILWLTELAPVVEMPPYVVGAMNYRGHTLPVVDLLQRFGRESRPYEVTDQLVVIESRSRLVGVIVQRVQDIIHVQPNDVHETEAFASAGAERGQIITHSINRGRMVVMLLDHDAVMDGLDTARPGLAAPSVSFSARLDHLPVAQRETLQTRASSLAAPSAAETDEDSLALALIRIGDDWFGIDVMTVDQFIRRPAVTTPVPCSPPHVFGASNFEGDVLTLVDVSTALDSTLTGTSEDSRVVVIRRGEFLVGALIDDVMDVVFVEQSDVRDVEGSVLAANHGFLRGVAEHSGRLVGILDLLGIVMQDEWIVDERVI